MSLENIILSREANCITHLFVSLSARNFQFPSPPSLPLSPEWLSLYVFMLGWKTVVTWLSTTNKTSLFIFFIKILSRLFWGLGSAELKDCNRNGLELSFCPEWTSGPVAPHLHFPLTPSKVRRVVDNFSNFHFLTDNQSYRPARLELQIWLLCCCRPVTAGTGNGSPSGEGRGRSSELPRWATSLSRSYK